MGGRRLLDQNNTRRHITCVERDFSRLVTKLEKKIILEYCLIRIGDLPRLDFIDIYAIDSFLCNNSSALLVASANLKTNEWGKFG